MLLIVERAMSESATYACRTESDVRSCDVPDPIRLSASAVTRELRAWRVVLVDEAIVLARVENEASASD